MTETETMRIEHIKTMDSEGAVKLVRELCAQLEREELEVHGNIWPGNVSFNEDGTAVLGDCSDVPAAEREAIQVEFMPPEYFWDNSVTAAGDVYSLGMLLYAGCNDGFLPFQPKSGVLTDQDRSTALRLRMKGEPISLPAGMTPQLGAVIRKALAYEPEDRYQSVGELLTALSATDEALPGAETAKAAGAALAGAAMAEDLHSAETAAVTAEAPAEEAAPAMEAPAAGAAPEREMPRMTPERKNVPAQKADARSRKSKKDAKAARDTKTRTGARGSSAVPASRRKKKASPVIPILCVAALAVIGGAAWIGFNHGGEVLERLNLTRQAQATPEVSEPYVIVAESPEPEPTAAPVPSSVEDDILLPFNVEEPEPTEEPAPTPEPTPEPIVGSATVDGVDVTPEDDVVVIITSGTNLRGGPGTSYEIGKTLSRGIQLVRTGTVNGWSQVQYEGEEYYVSTNLVEVDEEATKEKLAESLESSAPAETLENSAVTPAPAPASASTPAPSATPAPTVSSAPIVTNPGTPAVTGTSAGTVSGNSGGNSGNGGGSATPSSASVTATRDVVSVTGAEVNLRSGPGTGYSVVTTVSNGTTLQRTGTVNGWSRVAYQGGEAYVIDTYITPVSSSTVSAAAGTARVTSDVNVRSGANTDSSILSVAKVGTDLTITGITDGGKWYRVNYNGQEGYVNRKLISVQSFALVSERSGSAKVNSYSNVRSGPGTGYSVLGQANTGDTLTVTGYADNNWYKVSFNGQTGYIAGNLVSVS